MNRNFFCSGLMSLIFISSCAPVNQVSQIETTNQTPQPEIVGIVGAPSINQESRSCRSLYIPVGSGTSRDVKPSDDYSFVFEVPNGVKYQPEVDGSTLYYCFYPDLTTIPDTYIMKFSGTVNRKSYAGETNLYISPSAVAYVRFGEFNATRGAKSCSPVLARVDKTASFMPIQLQTIALKINAPSRVLATTEVFEGSSAICFAVAADAVVGNYKVVARGMVNGIGIGEELSLIIR